MSEDKKGVKEEVEVSPAETQTEELLSPEEQRQKDWDEQPAIVSKDGEAQEEEPEEEPEKPEEEKEDPVISALEKEKERIATKREKLLAEMKDIRKDNRTLEANKEVAVAEDSEEDDDWKVINAKIDEKVQAETGKAEFYSTNPIYQGEDGKKNIKLLEEYVSTYFKKSTNKARQMAHSEIFGEFEKDSAAREAKVEQTQKMVKANIATLGSNKGQTDLETPEPPRKRIIPKQTASSEWYS